MQGAMTNEVTAKAGPKGERQRVKQARKQSLLAVNEQFQSLFYYTQDRRAADRYQPGTRRIFAPSNCSFSSMHS